MNFKTKTKFEQNVENAIKPAIEDLGYKIVDIETSLIDGMEVLSIYVYNPDRSDIEGIVIINRKISEILDKIGVSEKYNIEISTPGISRKLKYADEFLVFEGKEVNILDSLENCNITGIIENLTEDSVEISVDNKKHLIKITNIKKAQLNS